MRFYLLITFALVALVSNVNCGCERSNQENNPENSDVANFFKNVGCDIKKGAEKISDTARPWLDEIGKSAKKFGGSVADTFSDLKTKISGSSDNSTTVKADVKLEASSTASSPLPDSPTPSSIDDRLLLDVPERCPPGERLDATNKCRKGGF